MSVDPDRWFCRVCVSPRKTSVCQKCGSATFNPPKICTELELPSIDRIRELAKEVGYAVGVHGTLERDLDLIAAPWTENAIGNHALLEHLAKGLNARIVSIERKPLGRYAANLQLDGWFKIIDISICPIIQKQEGESCV